MYLCFFSRLPLLRRSSGSSCLYAPARSLDDTLSPFVDAFLLDIIGCHQKHCSQEVRVDIIVFVVVAAAD